MKYFHFPKQIVHHKRQFVEGELMTATEVNNLDSDLQKIVYQHSTKVELSKMKTVKVFGVRFKSIL